MAKHVTLQGRGLNGRIKKKPTSPDVGLKNIETVVVSPYKRFLL